MISKTHAQLTNFIWSICNLLRGPYKHNEYRKVILPLSLLAPIMVTRTDRIPVMIKGRTA